MLAEAELQTFDNWSRTQSIKEIQHYGFPKEVIKTFVTLKNLIKNNDEAGYTNKLKEIYADLVEENFRNLVIKEMGYIKENTREENRAKKFFNDFLKTNAKPGIANYMEEDGKIHAGKYSYDVRENEAIIGPIYGNRFFSVKFKKFSIQNTGDFISYRKGRIIHPFITRIIQKYGLYIQRQALPRMPYHAVYTPEEIKQLESERECEEG